MLPKRALRERFRTWRRSLRDPLRGGKAAARWIETLPTADPLQLQREALDLVASFPGGRRRIGPPQVDALLRVDEWAAGALRFAAAPGAPDPALLPTDAVLAAEGAIVE